MSEDAAGTGEARALDEQESKALLADFGIPVVEERRAADAAAAATAAAELGFPVVLKACAAGLAHKTELGLVCLNLGDAAAVTAAAGDLLARVPDATRTAGVDFLVQRQVAGHRELLLGLSRDPQFGPCVSFGLGGVLTEALEDVVFRVAPIEPADAEEMLDEIRGAKLLGPFRGEAAADRTALVQALLGLSRLGLERDDVREVDVNPMIITAEGRPVAVDALVLVDAAT